MEGGIHDPKPARCFGWEKCGPFAGEAECLHKPDAKCLHCGQTFCRIHMDDHLKHHRQAETGPAGS